MKISIIAIVFLIFLTTSVQAQQSPPKLGQPKIYRVYQDEISAAIDGLPENASQAQLSDAMQRILPIVLQSDTGSIPATVRAFQLLGQQPNILPALSKSYQGIPKENYAERVFFMSLIGEARIPNSFSFFSNLIWKELPPKSEIVEGLSPRDYEEMIQSKAVSGIALIKTAKSNAEVLRVMHEHEARSVKIAGIEAYIWNQDDQIKAIRQLYETLPTDLHPFVERPRYQQGMDRVEFDRQVNDWTKSWGSQVR